MLKRFTSRKMILAFVMILVVGLFAGCASNAPTAGPAAPAAGPAAGPAGAPPPGAPPPGGPPAGGPPAGAPAGPPPPPPSFVHAKPFSVITMGTGAPMPNDERASACTVVQYKGKYYVLDIGNLANNRFATYKYSYKDINAVLFTHLHLDHTSDYFDLMVNRWMTGGKEVTLVGPPTTGKMQEFLTTFFKDDLKYRQLRGIAAGVKDVGMFTGVTVKEIKGGDKFDLDGLKVTTAELTHTQYNIGYRFDADGKSVVVSGDTSFDQDLITLAKNADVLVMDASFDKAYAQNTEANAFSDKSIVKPTPESKLNNFNVQPHPILPDMIKIAVESNVKKMVFTHFAPKPFVKADVEKAFRDAGYKGEFIYATDGMEVNF